MIKRSDLVNITDRDYKYQREHEFMQCQDCGEEFGGTQGDYWGMGMDDVFDCPNTECMSRNIAIVRRVSKIVIVKQ